MIISWRKFEFGVWFLYFRSRDSREELTDVCEYHGKKTLGGVPHGAQFVQREIAVWIRESTSLV